MQTISRAARPNGWTAAAAWALVASGALLAAWTPGAAAAITDLSTWTLVQDPPNANFTVTPHPTAKILLAGNAAVPSGTDIGYQSVNGATPAASTAGHAFDPAASFSVAIDYAMSFANTPSGGLAIGFGIGEDGGGANSAGAVMFTANGNPQLFGAAARVNDVNQAPAFIVAPASLTGTLFASYDAASGNVTLGATPAAGAVAPLGTATFAGIQNSWAGGDLLASFFLRSDASLGTAWQGGNGQATFSNFRVLSGTPVAIVPEPSAVAMLGVLAVAATLRRRMVG